MALSQPGRGSEDEWHRVLFLALSVQHFPSVVDGRTEVGLSALVMAPRWEGLLIE